MPFYSANISDQLLFSKKDIPSRFAEAAASDFEAVELRHPYNIPIPDLLSYLDDESCPNRLELTCIDSYSNILASNRPGFLGFAAIPGAENLFDASLTKTIEYVRETGCRTINILAGCPLYSPIIIEALKIYYQNPSLSDLTSLMIPYLQENYPKHYSVLQQQQQQPGQQPSQQQKNVAVHLPPAQLSFTTSYIASEKSEFIYRRVLPSYLFAQRPASNLELYGKNALIKNLIHATFIRNIKEASRRIRAEIPTQVFLVLEPNTNYTTLPYPSIPFQRAVTSTNATTTVESATTTGLTSPVSTSTLSSNNNTSSSSPSPSSPSPSPSPSSPLINFLDMNNNVTLGYYLTNYFQILELLADADVPNCGILFDTYHAYRAHGCISTWFSSLLPIIRHVQVSNILTVSVNGYKGYTSLGKYSRLGQTNFREVIKGPDGGIFYIANGGKNSRVSITKDFPSKYYKLTDDVESQLKTNEYGNNENQPQSPTKPPSSSPPKTPVPASVPSPVSLKTTIRSTIESGELNLSLFLENLDTLGYIGWTSIAYTPDNSPPSSLPNTNASVMPSIHSSYIPPITGPHLQNDLPNILFSPDGKKDKEGKNDVTDNTLGPWYIRSRKRRYLSAGILFTCSGKQGKPYVLLGLDSKRDSWGPFFGRPDRTDPDPITTAIRETMEESLGVVYPENILKSALEKQGYHDIIPNTNLYVINMGILTTQERGLYSTRFIQESKRRFDLAKHEKEIKKIEWFDFSEFYKGLILQKKAEVPKLRKFFKSMIIKGLELNVGIKLFASKTAPLNVKPISDLMPPPQIVVTAEYDIANSRNEYDYFKNATAATTTTSMPVPTSTSTNRSVSSPN